jgi:Flp pilus assembly pilin Flp
MSSPRDSSQPAVFRARLTAQTSCTTADQRGATAVEYALIAGGLGAVVAATVYSVGITTVNLALSNWF